MSRKQHSKQTFGAVLIVLGSLFLLDNLDLFPYDLTHYIFKWQSIMIIIGMVILATKPEKNTGIVLVAIGVFFLLPEFEILRFVRLRTWWPALLIVVGLLFIAMHQESNNKEDKFMQNKKKDSAKKKSTIDLK